MSPLDALRRTGLPVLAVAAIVALAVTLAVILWPHGSAQAAVTLSPQFPIAAAPTAAQLESRPALRMLARRTSWHGSLGSLRGHLFVVQHVDSPSIGLVAQAGSAEKAHRLANAWAAIAARIGIRNLRRFLTVRESFERSLGLWDSNNGGGGPVPKLSRVTSRVEAQSGRYALRVVAANPTRIPRSKYVWTRKIFPAVEGDRFYIRAYVTGIARKTRPISLGVRVTPAGGLTRVGVAKTNGGRRWLIQGLYRVPRGVTGIQPAVWQDEVPAHVVTRFAVDDVALLPRRLGNYGLVAQGAVRVKPQARSYALALGAGLASAFLLVLFAAMLPQAWVALHTRN